MKTILLPQGSPEWLELKNGKIGIPESGTIGSSEVASILNIGAFYPETSEKLLKMKADHVLPPEKRTVPTVQENPAMLKGKLYEDQIRSYHQALIGVPLQPLVAVHDTYPYMLASFDAITIDESRIGEYKTSRKTYEEVLKGIIAPHYYSQVQHQLAISNAKVCDFIAYDPDSDKYAVMQVFPDDHYILNMQMEVSAFYSALVEYKTKLLSGEITSALDSDLVPIEWSSRALQVIKIQDELDAYEDMCAPLKAKKEQLTAELIKLIPDGSKRFSGAGIQLTLSTRKGSIDLERMQQELSIPESVVESYRKPSSESSKLTFLNSKKGDHS